MKLTKEQKEILKSALETLKEAKETEDDLYEKYQAQGRVMENLKAGLVKTLVDFGVTELYQLSYNYMDKLEEIVK